MVCPTLASSSLSLVYVSWTLATHAPTGRWEDSPPSQAFVCSQGPERFVLGQWQTVQSADWASNGVDFLVELVQLSFPATHSKSRTDSRGSHATLNRKSCVRIEA